MIIYNLKLIYINTNYKKQKKEHYNIILISTNKHISMEVKI